MLKCIVTFLTHTRLDTLVDDRILAMSGCGLARIGVQPNRYRISTELRPKFNEFATTIAATITTARLPNSSYNLTVSAAVADGRNSIRFQPQSDRNLIAIRPNSVFDQIAPRFLPNCNQNLTA